MSQFFYTNVAVAGDDILFRGLCKSKDGQWERYQDKVKYNPILYIPSDKPTTHLCPVDGQYCQIYTRPDGNLPTIKEAKKFVNNNQGMPGGVRVYGMTNYAKQFIVDCFPKDIPYDTSALDALTIDIEVLAEQGFPSPDRAADPIVAITIHSTLRPNKYVCWGLKEYDPKQTILEGEYEIEYVQCRDEQQLLNNFFEYWDTHTPDIVTGWNSRFFDIPYIINRCKHLFSNKYAETISPWKFIYSRQINMMQNVLNVYEIPGIDQLDYLDLFKKFAYSYGTQASYKLDNILFTVLGTRKLDYSEYGSLAKMYHMDHQKYIDYNIRDVQGVVQLEDKLKLIELAAVIAYRARVNFADVFSPVGVWDSIIYERFKSLGYVVPPVMSRNKQFGIDGAYVKAPLIGKHDWVTSFDLNSLYPHIMMQYNLSPETIVNEEISNVTVDQLLDEKHYDFDRSCYNMTARGNLFRIDKQGIIPKLVQDLYDQRSAVKKDQLAAEQELVNHKGEDKRNLEKTIARAHNQQMAIKILMNSLYGAMSNEYFRFYDTRIAESITHSGQLTIRWAEKHLNKYLNNVMETTNVDYVIAIDTDSVYLNFGPFVKKYLPSDSGVEKIVATIDQICKKQIEPFLEKTFDKLKQYLNAYEQKMVMAREVIAETGIWTGKKHYALALWNNEGVQYNKPKLKVVGIEAVRSSTPQICRDHIKEILMTIMLSDERTVQKEIAEFRKKFNQSSANECAFPRSVNNMQKYQDSTQIYAKGTPVAVRGALLYNHKLAQLVQQQKVDDNMYEQIYTGSKIKWLYLKKPNPITENVIAFPNDQLPGEFELEPYIDYNTQFEKSFINPISKILKCLNWTVTPQASLLNFIKRTDDAKTTA